MHLSLRQLQIFMAVADSGSTMAAARLIALSQSAVSSALAELERSLGNPLFDRIGKRLYLNEEGRALLIDARNLLDSAQDLETRHSVQSEGSTSHGHVRLRLGASTTIANYLLPDLIAGFIRVEPQAEVDVAIGNTREIALSVARLEVDLGMIEGPCHDPELTVWPWMTDELVIACAPNQPLARLSKRGAVSVEQLRQASWLLREPGSGTREVVEQALLPVLHQLNTQVRFGSTEAIKRAARAGLGVTCLSRFALEDMLTSGELALVRTSMPSLRRTLYFVSHKNKRLSQGMSGFLTHCEP